MSNKTYQKIFKALTVFYAIPFFMTSITLLDRFVLDLIMYFKCREDMHYLLHNEDWRYYDPIYYLQVHYESALICLLLVVILSLIIGLSYRKTLNSKAKTMIFAGCAVAGVTAFASQFGFFFSLFELLIGVGAFVYGIFTVKLMRDSTKEIDADNPIEYEYKEPSDAHRINYYIMITVYVICYLYWICFCGTGVYDMVINVKNNSKHAWTYHHGEIWDILFCEETIIGFALLNFLILGIIAVVTIAFYRNYLKRRNIAAIIITGFLPIVIMYTNVWDVPDITMTEILGFYIAKLFAVTASGITGTVLMLKDLEEFD